MVRKDMENQSSGFYAAINGLELYYEIQGMEQLSSAAVEFMKPRLCWKRPYSLSSMPLCRKPDNE